MKVLLIQYDLNPQCYPAVTGQSGIIYGRASYNPRLVRHECLMDLEKFQDPKTFRDLFNALRRPGSQWFPLFQVPADSAAGELETVKIERDALVAEVNTLKAEVTALKAELVGDEAEAVAGDLQSAKQDGRPLEKRGMHALRREARRLGHKLTGSPTKDSLIAFIREKQAEPAAV